MRGTGDAQEMATNLAHAASQVIGAASPLGVVRGWWFKASRSLSSAMCGLNGHDPLLQVDNGRMFLRCSTCGHETPGWTTSERRPRQRFGGDHARHRLN
jgi:hypothetical protein